MRVTVAALVLAIAVKYTKATDPAPIISGNPVNVVYTATLPEKPFFKAPEHNGNIKGFISASTPPDGIGVRFTIRFENLPKTGGPFSYHLHVNKATNGDCAATGGHLDPLGRGDKPPCDTSNLASCQVGDSSGKFGKINSDPFLAEYVDQFASLKEADAAFFGNRSFVIHLANSTRITCADFVRNQPDVPNVTLPGSSTTTSADCGGPPPTAKPTDAKEPPECGCDPDDGDDASTASTFTTKPKATSTKTPPVQATTKTTTTTTTTPATTATPTTNVVSPTASMTTTTTTASPTTAPPTKTKTTSTSTTTSTPTPTPTENSTTTTPIPTPTIVTAAAGRIAPGPFLRWMTGVALMMFAHY